MGRPGYTEVIELRVGAETDLSQRNVGFFGFAEFVYGENMLFPAGTFPLTYIKNLKGPFENTEYVAVGGVSPKNMYPNMEQGFECVLCV